MTLLIPIAKKVLNSINYLCSESETTSSLDIVVYLHNKTKDLDLLNTLTCLQDEGYIVGESHGNYWDNIKPTYKGKHYNQFAWIKTKEFLIKSILVPIGVSFLTSLLTYLFFQ